MPPSPGVPQTSQYPSTMVPVQPGCWQAPEAAALAATGAAASAASAPGIPQTSQYPSTTWPAHPGWVQAGAAVVVLIGFPHGS